LIAHDCSRIVAGASVRLREHVRAGVEAHALGLARAIARRLRSALRSRDAALLALSGGRSPLPMLRWLRRQPLSWERVIVTQVDERCVPADHADSNARLLREHFLVDAAAAARWVPLCDPAMMPAEPDDAALDRLASAANARLASLPWPLDVAVLGMGEDGHTASIFPAAPGLQRALSADGPVCWTRPVTAPHARLTLTLPTLTRAGTLMLSLQGATKQAVYVRACTMPDVDLPVSLVLHQAAAPVQVWIAD
jgi:6-phosphogluconolactonase